MAGRTEEEMNLTVYRHLKGIRSTLGELWIDGTHFCYTLERPYETVEGAEAPFCIPAGVYPASISWMEDMGIDAPLLQKTEPRTGIFIHYGNYPKDTKGCVLVGSNQDVDYVGESRVTFGSLIKVIGTNTFTVEIKDPEVPA
jgi:hypothetical protein